MVIDGHNPIPEWMGFFDYRGEELCSRVEAHVENDMFIAKPDIPTDCKLFVYKVGLSQTPDGPVLIEAPLEQTVTSADDISIGCPDEWIPWLNALSQTESVGNEKPIDDKQITAAVRVLKKWNEKLS